MEDQSAWYYISKVTLSEAWSELKENLGTLLIWIVIFYVIGYFTGFEPSGSSASSKKGDFVPSWITIPGVISALLWLSRGATIRIPNPNFKEWLIVSLILFGAFAALSFLSFWIWVPILFLSALAWQLYDRFVQIGREKFPPTKRC
jgi:hypothetical protein